MTSAIEIEIYPAGTWACVILYANGPSGAWTGLAHTSNEAARAFATALAEWTALAEDAPTEPATLASAYLLEGDFALSLQTTPRGLSVAAQSQSTDLGITPVTDVAVTAADLAAFGRELLRSLDDDGKGFAQLGEFTTDDYRDHRVAPVAAISATHVATLAAPSSHPVTLDPPLAGTELAGLRDWLRDTASACPLDEAACWEAEASPLRVSAHRIDDDEVRLLLAHAELGPLWIVATTPELLRGIPSEGDVVLAAPCYRPLPR